MQHNIFNLKEKFEEVKNLVAETRNKLLLAYNKRELVQSYLQVIKREEGPIECRLKVLVDVHLEENGNGLICLSGAIARCNQIKHLLFGRLGTETAKEELSTFSDVAKKHQHLADLLHQNIP